MQTLQTGAILQNGKYKIKKILGQGGFGITYLAEQDMLYRQVAIKEFFFKEYCDRDILSSSVTLGTQSNKETVARFLQKFIKEARTISNLHHPGIIEIYDIFMENNTAYYVMEFIEGESLGDIVRRRGALPEKEALGYIRETAEVLNYIHARNINHLDIKPNNIMLRSRDSKIIVIDFGVAKQYDEDTKEGTTTTPVGISHGYSPIEQYKKNGVSSFSPQADIYSLGATLYKLVTGVTPPEAIDIAQGGLPSIETPISEKVKNAVLVSMRLQKDARPQSISAFIDLLDNNEEEPIVVKPISSCVTEDDEPTQIVDLYKEVISESDHETIEKENLPKVAPNRVAEDKSDFWIIIIVGAIIIISALCMGIIFHGDANKPDSSPLVDPEYTPKKELSESVTNYEIKNYDGSTAYYWNGPMVEGYPEGKGTIKYLSNDKDNRLQFVGRVFQGIRKEGSLYYNNGDWFEGSFSEDLFKEGRLTLKSDGVYFFGSFKDNQPWNGKWYFLNDNSLYSNIKDGKEIIERSDNNDL